MLDDIAPSLSHRRVNELEVKLRSRDDQTVPAEWEIAVGFALSKVGKIIDPGDQRSGNPDFIFLPRGSSDEIIIEVTSLSDRTADVENPVDDFIARLSSVGGEEGITPRLGTFNWRLENVEVEGRIIIGVPARRDIEAFFKSPAFRAFASTIKASPNETHSYQFEARGAAGVITFAPGKQYTTGGHRSYKIAQRLDDSRVFNALKKKEKQLSKAALDLPAVVFLCDNDCDLLRYEQMYSPGTFRIDDIVTAFLNGRPHWQQGPLIFQEGMPKKGNRIHAIVTLTVHRPWGFGGLHNRLELRGRLIPASHCADSSIRSEDFLRIMNAAVAQLPVPSSTPNNALRKYRWPASFGGGMMTGNEVKVSLLTLQKLLAGEISYEEFSESQDMLAVQLRNLDAKGLMITSVEIVRQEDNDDDWITLRFGGLQPDRLFDPNNR
ncbi:MAG: hypothetical protein H0V78_08975 [Burkholderiales bacterium]|nr:hypothetical protein [Burkholderiales bacterium]